MTNLFDPPAKYVLPLAKGQDVDVEITYRVLTVDEDGAPVLDMNGNRQYEVANIPTGATITLTIEPDTSATATITGSRARMTVDHAEVDVIKNGTLWRVVMSETSGLDTVLVHGTVQRYDGK